jgi:DNA-directed RNA polymerase specialized sigma24 family protein
LKKLSDESRELIVAYYREQQRAKIKLRKELAERLGIPLNALRIRAHRIRAKLEECVVNCLQQSQGAAK